MEMHNLAGVKEIKNNPQRHHKKKKRKGDSQVRKPEPQIKGSHLKGNNEKASFLLQKVSVSGSPSQQNTRRPALSETQTPGNRGRERGCMLSRLHQAASPGRARPRSSGCSLTWLPGVKAGLLTDSSSPSRATGTPSLPPLSSNFQGWLLIPHKKNHLQNITEL